MKKNYISLTHSHTTTKTCELTFLKRKANLLLLLLFTLLGFNQSSGQVTINTASGSINSCAYPTNYVNLGNIFLEENNNANFNIILQNFDYTLIMTAPTNFEFRPGVGTVTFRATGDITAASINVTTTTITVTYRSSDGNRTNNDDRLTISNIEFRGITAPSTGNITRTALGGGTGIINGAGSGSTYGTLTSTNTPLGAIGGGAATVCAGATTPAFTNGTPGGTWSITPGTGTATISAGGVATGTSAGTVTVVYTLNGCTATRALTVSTSPAAIGGGAATVCVGATTPAFTNSGGTWSITNGTGSATISAGGVVTGVTAGTATVVYSIGTCTTSTPITIITTPTTVVGPTPANAATGVCFTGAGAVTSISWAASASATSYDVYFGAGSLPGSITANVATNSYTLGTLNANTTYYWQVVPRNACGATSGTPATWTFTTTAAPCACVPTSANATYPISNVTFAGINNNSSATVTAGPDYQDFTTISGNVTAGSTYNISVTSTGATGNTFYQYVFFDWNNNGNFSDDGGPYNIGNYTTASGTFNLNITIPQLELSNLE